MQIASVPDAEMVLLMFGAGCSLLLQHKYAITKPVDACLECYQAVPVSQLRPTQ